MEINLEKNDPHSVQSYNTTQVTINHIQYTQNIIVDQAQIIPWNTHADKLTLDDLNPLLHLMPEVIIIGYAEKNIHLAPEILSILSQRRIGIECMALGAACRTFNVLLNEKRRVALGILFQSS